MSFSIPPNSPDSPNEMKPLRLPCIDTISGMTRSARSPAPGDSHLTVMRSLDSTRRVGVRSTVAGMAFDENNYLAEHPEECTEGALRALVEFTRQISIRFFQVILDSAVSLCHTDKGFIYLNDQGVYRHVAHVGATPEVVAFNQAVPIVPTRGTLEKDRAVLEQPPGSRPRHRTQQRVRNREAQRLGGFKTLLEHPEMLHRGGHRCAVGLRTEDFALHRW